MVSYITNTLHRDEGETLAEEDEEESRHIEKGGFRPATSVYIHIYYIILK